MFKKLTAYSFIVLANIILLTHAVIPHHHHNRKVCIENTRFINDENAHMHDSSEHNHQHKDTNSDNYCILSQTKVIVTVQQKLPYSCDNCSDNSDQDYVDLFIFGSVDISSVSIIAENAAEFSSVLASFDTTTPSLRAPPIV